MSKEFTNITYGIWKDFVKGAGLFVGACGVVTKSTNLLKAVGFATDLKLPTSPQSSEKISKQ